MDNLDKDALPQADQISTANTVWSTVYDEGGILVSRGIATTATLPDGTIVPLPGPLETGLVKVEIT